MRKIHLPLLFPFLFIACQKGEVGKKEMSADHQYSSQNMRSEGASVVVDEQAIDEQAIDEVEQFTHQKIIKDGQLYIEVKQLNEAKVAMDSLVKKYQAYFANEDFRDDKYQLSMHCVLRIPAQSFESFVAEFEQGRGKVTSKQINSRDVTSEYIDLEIRLENKLEYLKRYQNLLKKANSIKEILEIEQKIRILEEELESTKGRLKYLNNQLDYSILKVILTQKKEFKYTPEERDSLWERLKESLSDGWDFFVSFFFFLLRLWPFLVGIALLVWGLRRVSRNRRNRKFPTV